MSEENKLRTTASDVYIKASDEFINLDITSKDYVTISNRLNVITDKTLKIINEDLELKKLDLEHEKLKIEREKLQASHDIECLKIELERRKIEIEEENMSVEKTKSIDSKDLEEKKLKQEKVIFWVTLTGKIVLTGATIAYGILMMDFESANSMTSKLWPLVQKNLPWGSLN